jgi:hypothetical protein
MPLPFTPPLIGRFAEPIRSLPQLPEYGPEHLCTPTFRLHADSSIEMFYAPLDYVNTSAKVAIVGITPGFQQMEIAFRTTRAALAAGKSGAEACRQAKVQASFAGPMRRNLISMLADIGLHDCLGISDPALLFDTYFPLLHTTSAIRYPAFVHGDKYDNYTGHAPALLRHPVLHDMVFDVLSLELAEVPGALIIPLGKAVEGCLSALISAGVLSRERCLFGFPHPGGGNGHRKRQLELNSDMLKTKTAGWFKKTAGA